jgi:hypothetical protein
MTFVFAVTAGVGFASTNIADVTLARASRAMPAVQMAQAALSDAMAARDRECGGGVGKFCREREAAVNERRQALDAAMQSVGQTADPQTGCSGLSCWRCCRKSVAYCSWSDERPSEPGPRRDALAPHISAPPTAAEPTQSPMRPPAVRTT